jgi:hypothetical protein
MAPCTVTSAARSYDPGGQRTEVGKHRAESIEHGVEDGGQKSETETLCPMPSANLMIITI